MHIRRFHESLLVRIARRNRREIIAAGLSRREMIKHGLIGATGYLAYKSGLSNMASGAAWAAKGPAAAAVAAWRRRRGDHQPPVRPFVEPMPIIPVKRPVASLTGPAPTIAPNTAGGEGRPVHTRPSRPILRNSLSLRR